MACGGCGAYWCWRCNKEIDGYRHFRTGECILFDEAEILRCVLWRKAHVVVLPLLVHAPACCLLLVPLACCLLSGWLPQNHRQAAPRWPPLHACRWEAQWEEMQAAARVMAAGMRNEYLGETAARGGGRVRGCFCPQCGQVNHKLGECMGGWGVPPIVIAAVLAASGWCQCHQGGICEPEASFEPPHWCCVCACRQQ